MRSRHRRNDLKKQIESSLSDSATDAPTRISGPASEPPRIQSVVAWAVMAGLLLIPAVILLIVLNQ